MNWKQVGRFVRTVFLLRVPLFTLAVLAALGPLAHTVAQNFLANLFDVRVLVDNPVSGADQGRLPPLRLGWSAWSLFAVSFAAFMLAWAAVSVINLIVHYGKDRFDDPALDLEQKHSLLTFLCGLAAALSLVIWAIRDTRIEWYVRYGMPLLALA